MTTSQDERSVRLTKLTRLRALGVSVYPAHFAKTSSLASLATADMSNVRHLDEIKTGPVVQYSTAGRIVLLRSFGKMAFAHLQDETGRFQVLLSQEACRMILPNGTQETTQETIEGSAESLSAFKVFEKCVDMGDFIGVRGELFFTKTGERTLFVSEWQFLGKALRPLPEKFHGLQDEEARYRKRYLDLITDDTTMQRFRFRSEFIRGIRDFYHQNGFIEIEGQTLTNTPTGAAARPYITHQNALGMDVFLRISHEIPLKLVNVAGMERVFELGKAFRNEGQDPSHLPEHTHLEHNASYWTFEDNMRFTEEMFDFLFDRLGLARKRNILSKSGELVEVDFTTPWRRENYVDLVQKATGLDVSTYRDADTLRTDLAKKNIRIEGMEGMGLTTLIDYVYKKTVRPNLIHPTFLTGYPVELKPFARRNDENANRVDAFQLVVNGWELVNSYSELVDPIDQAERFARSNTALENGDEEAMRSDMEFVEAMEHGMPPISGWGLGVDRLLALLTEQNNLRDVVLFPLLKPEEPPKSAADLEAMYRSRKCVMIADPSRPIGVVANALSHLGIMLAEHAHREMNATFVGEVKHLYTADGVTHLGNSLYPIANLAGSVDALRSIMAQARDVEGVFAADFTTIMARAHTEKQLITGYAALPENAVEPIGVCLFWPTELVERLTAGLPLYGKDA